MLKEQLLQIAKPILFNTEMVKAILEGRKTQTRRIVGDKILNEIYKYDCYIEDGKIFESCMCQGMPDGSGGLEVDRWEQDVTTTYSKYKVGDILYIRETFKIDSLSNLDKRLTILFKTGDKLKINEKEHNQVFEKFDKRLNGKWKPSIHMPKEYARIFLKVTNIRVSRLTDMSTFEKLKEGYSKCSCLEWLSGNKNGATAQDVYNWFKTIWNSTAKDGYKWEDNPYVFVYEFQRVEVC